MLLSKYTEPAVINNNLIKYPRRGFKPSCKKEYCVYKHQEIEKPMYKMKEKTKKKTPSFTFLRRGSFLQPGSAQNKL